MSLVVKQTVEPIMHMPPTTDVHADPLAQPTTTSQSAGWTKQDVKKWMTEKNLADISKK